MPSSSTLGVSSRCGSRSNTWPSAQPPFTRFRWPGKWLHLVAFSLPFVGAIGLQAVLADASGRLVRIALGIGGVVIVVVGAATIAGGAGFYATVVGASFEDATRLGAARAESLRTLLTVVVAVALLAVLLRPRWRPLGAVLLAGLALVDAGTRSRSLHGVLPSDVVDHVPSWVEEARSGPRVRVHTTHSLGQLWLYGQSAPAWYVWARDASMGESLLPLGVDRTWGFGQLIPRRQWEAWERLQDPALSSFERERVSDLLNVGLVIHGPPFDEARIKSGRIPELRFHRRDTHLPRAFVAPETVVADDPWPLLLDPEFDPRRTAVVSGLNAHKYAGTGPVGATDVSVTHSWNRIEVRVRSDENGRLVLLEPYDARWSFSGDGGESYLPVHRANGLFMGVSLPKGEHTLIFRYREPALLAGSVIAGAALVALIFLALRKPSA